MPCATKVFCCHRNKSREVSIVMHRRNEEENYLMDASESHELDFEDLEPYEQDQLPSKKNDGMREIHEMIIYFIVVVTVVLLFNNYVAQQVQVDGSSMNMTLQDNDRLILEKLSYHFGDPERFDIIVFRPFSTNKYYIKRVIGLPGETVQITDGTIYINGTELEEDYGMEEMIDSGIAIEPLTLSKDEFFVLGDNRNNSQDSRDSEVGLVSRDSIAGRAYLRIWPLNKLEVLKHQ